MAHFSENKNSNLANGAVENLFPEELRQAAGRYFKTDALGMSLLRQQPLSSASDASASADLDRCFARFLHPHEQAQAATYRLIKRRTEYLAGRVSAKLALAEFWATLGWRPSLPAVEIVNDSTGRPLVRMEAALGVENRPLPEISISHGGAYGAALAAGTPCGIDLQEQKDTLVRVLDKYCSAAEDLILAASVPEMALTARLSLLWTAKEAAKKACSCRWMPGFLDLKLNLPVRREAGCFVISLSVTRAPEDLRLPLNLTVLAAIFHHYGLAVCTLNEVGRHAGTAGS